MWGKASYRVLIIDETKYCKKIIQKQLAKHSVIVVYSDTHRIQDKIQNLKPNIIICDVEAFKQDGEESIRKLVASCCIPIFIMAFSEEGVLEALFAGAKGCFPKPDANSIKSIEIFVNDILINVKATITKKRLFSIFG